MAIGVGERPLKAVPPTLLIALTLVFLLQLKLASGRGGPQIEVQQLPPPPGASTLRLLALGDAKVAARMTMLWLQAFDYQPGVSLSFQQLDYALVEAWLERILELDPTFSYPLLAAARLYAEVPDEARQRRMLDFVERKFVADPMRHWQWMAHAVYVAKHRLRDQSYALRLAQQLVDLPSDPAIPSWVSQMHIFVLEDMGELESARVLIGGLLESGEITDPHEQWFLSHRLADLEARLAATAADDQASGSTGAVSE